MRQGLLPYTVEVVADADGLTNRAGLPLVLETMRALGLDHAIAQHVQCRARQSGYTETAKIEALVLLLAAGGECLDDIAVLQADGGLGRLLGRKLPSADTLRHFLYALHQDRLIAQAQAARLAGQVAYIPAENAPLQEWAPPQSTITSPTLTLRQRKGRDVSEAAVLQDSAVGGDESRSQHPGGGHQDPVRRVSMELAR